MTTIYSIVYQLATADDLTHWWNRNIQEHDQLEAVSVLKKWLETYPNIISGYKRGDPLYNTGRIDRGYNVFGMKISTDQKISLYNFFNKPSVVVKYYNYSLKPQINKAEVLNGSFKE